MTTSPRSVLLLPSLGLVFLGLMCLGVARCVEVHISDAQDLLALSKLSESGTETFHGTTIILDADIDMGAVSSSFKPICSNGKSVFNGKFDGRGHVISNLNLVGDYKFMGLFGSSNGTFIHDVVLDATCSFVSGHVGSNPNVGSLLGYCNSTIEDCVFERIVSLANLTYNKQTTSVPSLYVGGIAADCAAMLHDCKFLNTVSGGPIHSTGMSNAAYVGGSLGRCASFNGRCYLRNVESYATLHVGGQVTSNVYIGGVLGLANFDSFIANCVSMGPLNIITKMSHLYSGAVVGFSSGRSFTSMSTIENCFWDKDKCLGYEGGYGGYENTNMFSLGAFASPSFALDSPVTVVTADAQSFNTTSLTVALNTHKSCGGLPLWVTLSSGTCEAEMDVSPRVFPCVFPDSYVGVADFSCGGNAFAGWYVGDDLHTRVSLSSCPSYGLDEVNVSEENALYARWSNDVVVSFHTGSRDATYFRNLVLRPGGSFTLPGEVPVLDGCTFRSWDLLTPAAVDYDPSSSNYTVRSGVSDVAFSVVWDYKSFNVTFKTSKGQVTKKVLAFNSTIEYPKDDGEAVPWHAYHWCLGTEYDPALCDIPTVPARDCVFNSILVPDTFTARFSTESGTLFAKVTAGYNSVIPYPDDVPQCSSYGGGGASYFVRWAPVRESVCALTEFNDTHYLMPPCDPTFIAVCTDSLSSSSAPSPAKKGNFFREHMNTIITAVVGLLIVIAVILVAIGVSFYPKVKSRNGDQSRRDVTEKLVQMDETGRYPEFDESNYNPDFSPSSHGKSPKVDGENWADYTDKRFEGSDSSTEPTMAHQITVKARTVLESAAYENEAVCCDDGDGAEVSERGDKSLQSIFSNSTTSLKSTNTLDFHRFLYPGSYKPVSIKKALRAAGIPKDGAMKVAEACALKAKQLKDAGKIPTWLTIEDIQAIAMYTYDFGPMGIKNNPYRLINQALVSRSTMAMQQVRDILFLVLSALRKLPPVRNKILYRGVRVGVDTKRNYKVNSTILWTALSSTSPDMNVTKSFLTSLDTKQKASSTLFIINNGWGYNIQPFSLYPNEEEILLEPERLFRVTGVIPSPDITIVNLEMINTPLPLSDVFGYGMV